ncbi:MAG: helix-turn-helix transcriptional regulator [Bacteroidota bacterium]|nr:helix-turn-helix transcriptional regulator [Bacteroidota bacterium]
MSNDRILEAIGQNIKKLRAEKKISQLQLAGRCHFDKGRMSRIESGRNNLTVETLSKISDALEVNITELLQNQN